MISKIIVNYKMMSQQSLKSIDDWTAIAVLWRVRLPYNSRDVLGFTCPI